MEHVACDLCGRDDTRLLFHVRDTLLEGSSRYAIVLCCHCGLAYLNPRPTRSSIQWHYPEDYFNELGGGTVTNTFARRIFKNLLSRLTGSIASRIESLHPGKVLDVGCGDGRYLAFFQRLGWEAVGVDPSPVAVVRARQRGLQVAPPGELTAGCFPPETFDLVIMRYTIENMHSPSANLREARRVLKDGGIIFVSAPSITSPVARVFKQYCAYVEAPRHLYFFSPFTLRAMVEKAGFCLLEFARVAWPALFRDVLNRVSGGRYRKFLSRPWVSRSVWLAGMPLGLLLAYLGFNRGNMELIAEKRASAGEG